MKRLLMLFFVLFLFLGCDPEGRKQCEWVLEPGIPSQDLEKGYAPACARNRKTMKQDCRLQVALELAEKSKGKKFRYVDIKTKNLAIPRIITSIDFCE